MCKNVIIIGAGGHAKVIADIVHKSGDTVVGFLDDNASGDGILGKIKDCRRYNSCYFIIGIGNNHVRYRIATEYSDLRYCNAIHPSAVLGCDTFLGNGTVVMANAVINPSSVIGNHCIINTGAIIEHDNRISDYVHISPGGVLCGNVIVGECTHIGAGATVKNNITIVNDVTIGIGSAVANDVEKPGVYVGVPARWLK